MQKPTNLEPEQLPINHTEMTRELDRTKSRIFLGNNAAFLGSVMSALEFFWSRDIPTAATDGVKFWWNPEWFLSLPEPTRPTVLVHELWHVARLHMLRRGERCPEIWNIACDYRINDDLERDGYDFTDSHGLLSQGRFPAEMPEEDIYDILIKNGKPQEKIWGQDPSDGGGDMLPMDEGEASQVINTVVKAIHQAKLSKEAGNLPGDIEQVVETFLAPVIPWEAELQRFFTDMLEDEFTWKRPNRRHLAQDMYLPSRFQDEGRLEHLIYYLDVSGSISDHDVKRFNSEVKYVKEQFNPKKMTLVQFDHGLRDEKVIEEDDAFDKVVVIGRGGTCLVEVREHMIKHNPTAAIIFTDLGVAPMEPLPTPIPIIWAVTGDYGDVPFGKLIRIPEERQKL